MSSGKQKTKAAVDNWRETGHPYAKKGAARLKRLEAELKAPSPGQAPIRILHLSDLHLSAERRWDADPVLNGLTETIGELVRSGLAPDVVAITGDVADKGRPEDYAEARRWIDEKLRPALPTGFPGNRILIVPGNHDVNRDNVKPGTRALESGLLAAADQEAIADALSDPGQRGGLLRRHDAYLEFAKTYRPGDGPQDVPWWSTPLNLRGQKVHFAGVCSSWVSSSDHDYGRLLVGRWQVNELLKGSKNANWSIALVHHPWSWLAPFDGEEAESAVRRECHVILRGHLHREQHRLIHYPGDLCLELTAGSVYAGSRYANAFQLVELGPGEKEVAIHFRLWNDRRWIVDRNACPEATDGVARFTLGVVPTGVDGKPQPTPPEPAKYLRALRERTAYIDIRGLQVGSGRAYRFPIDELYVPLTTSGCGGGHGPPYEGFGGQGPPYESFGGQGPACERFGGHGPPYEGDELEVPATISGRPEVEAAKRKAEDEPPELGGRREGRIELDGALQNRHLVIVGNPGAGKTTFLHRIAHLLCRARLGERSEAVRAQLGLENSLFPIMIRLAELAEHITASRAQHAGPTLPDSPAWLPHFLATAGEDSGAGLDEEFFRSQLESGSALVMLDGLDEAPSEAHRKLLANLVQKASGGAYAQCRFVLTSRPAAYQGEAVLPQFAHARIEGLEDQAIERFLTRWCEALFPTDPKGRQRHLGELLGALRSRVEIRRIARNPVMLTALAVVHWNEKRLPEQRADLYESIISWLARSRQTRPGRPSPERCVVLHQELALAMQDHADGRQTQVPRFWAAQQLATEWREAPENERVRLAEAFLDQEELDSGIVVRRGNTVQFWHLTFQEYLAARALASCSEDTQRERLFDQPDKLHQPEWREVVLLAAGVLYYQGVRRVDAMFSAILAQLGENPSLADQARCYGLLGAAVRDLAPVNYHPADPRYGKMAEEVMAIFDAERSKSVAIEVAIEAAEVLGQAGDPRFAPGKLDENWVGIPAGEFHMGARKKKRSGANYDPDARDSESPVHNVQLPAYRIGKYPVTVGEYQRFVDDDGYAKEKYWPAGGFGKWKQPRGWEEQLPHSNRPVVGVSWYEAAAYAAWAGARLPTEAEWERAARGTEGRRYPWSNDKPDSSLANYYGNVGHATPVGVYPRGATPDGILDMVGNVWEWCQDVGHGTYDGAPTDGSARTTGGKESGRVFRGGSWYDDEIDLRSAYRCWDAPDLRIVNLGFRVAAGTYPVHF